MNNIAINFNIIEYNKIKDILINNEIIFDRFFWGEFNDFCEFKMYWANF